MDEIEFVEKFCDVKFSYYQKQMLKTLIKTDIKTLMVKNQSRSHWKRLLSLNHNSIS